MQMLSCTGHLRLFDKAVIASFAELWPPVLAKRPPSRSLGAKSVSFAEGTRGQRAPPNGSLPEAAAAADNAALAEEEVRVLMACQHTVHVAWQADSWIRSASQSQQSPDEAFVPMAGAHCDRSG